MDTIPLQLCSRWSAISLWLFSGQHGNARVVWISRSQWDLALVHIPAATPDYVDLRWYTYIPGASRGDRLLTRAYSCACTSACSPDDDVDVAYPGQGVAVVGHGLYSPSCGMRVDARRFLPPCVAQLTVRP